MDEICRHCCGHVYRPILCYDFFHIRSVHHSTKDPERTAGQGDGLCYHHFSLGMKQRLGLAQEVPSFLAIEQAYYV